MITIPIFSEWCKTADRVPIVIRASPPDATPFVERPPGLRFECRIATSDPKKLPEAAAKIRA
ncbi:MAG: hypothetical protein IPJ55_07530 [Chloracidobacterium sp.]|nr:hypothetical protein [Chloracidobacterium sp.]